MSLWRIVVSVSLLSLALPAFSAERDPLPQIKKDLEYLTSEECEGRGLKTKGIEKAAEYIANEFKKAGLKPGNPNGSYFQEFPVKLTFLLDGPHEFTVTTGPKDKSVEKKGEINKQFRVAGLSGNATFEGELVFVGYGISDAKKYDDYADLDVKGKAVVMMRKNPRYNAKKDGVFTPEEGQKYSSLTTKIEVAVKKGASAVIFINHAEDAKEDLLPSFEYATGDGSTKIPVLFAKRAFVESFLPSKIEELEKQIDKEGKPASVVVKDTKVKLQASVQVKEVKAKNVVGYLEGAGDFAKETVVLGAHYDHLGRGEAGSRTPNSTDIHHGADDNASGTTGLMELARRYGAEKERKGRRLVFVAFSGEEKGLLGSKYYAKNPYFPIKDTIAMLNMDMIGRVREDADTKKDLLEVGGVGSAKNFEQLLDDANKKFDYKLSKTKSGTGPSDHTSFYLEGVPVYFFFSKLHSEYHTPRDTVDTINMKGLLKVVNLVDVLTVQIATAKEKPEYVKGMGGSMSMGGGGGPKLGVMPGYDDANTKGMPVDGVVPGGAAEKGGVKSGDFIIGIAGTPVKNVQDYMKAMSTQKKDVELEIEIERNGKKMKLKVTPQ